MGRLVIDDKLLRRFKTKAAGVGVSMNKINSQLIEKFLNGDIKYELKYE